MTDDEILAVWDSCPLPDGCGPQIIAFARAIAAAEREACARVCEELDRKDAWLAYAADCADAIRARGEA